MKNIYSIFNYKIKKSVQLFYSLFVKPKSVDEDSKRREFILNILLLSTLFLMFVLSCLNLYYSIVVEKSFNTGRGLNPLIVISITLIFVFLYWLSRSGRFILASYLFIVIFLAPIMYMLYAWGAELPTGLILLSMIIIMSGILINTRFSFLLTLFICIFILSISYLQINKILLPNLYWKYEDLNFFDSIVFVVSLLVVSCITWLSFHEIEKSLKRARKSEADLRVERDSLEIKVEERTKELKKAQIEQISQLYRFAEFGRLSSGFFHDLANPLTAVSLNLSQLKESEDERLTQAKTYLNQALGATKRMEDFIIAIRKQIRKGGEKIEFSVNNEIKQIISILSYKARKADVELIFNTRKDITLYGDSVKFCHVITNIISNAIDSYDDTDINDKKVIVKLKQNEDSFILTVEDFGKGIAKDDVSKIFDPFFTTKKAGLDKGMGIGLSSSKNIIEKEFGGNIQVKSQIGIGTKFSLKFLTKNN